MRIAQKRCFLFGGAGQEGRESGADSKINPEHDREQALAGLSKAVMGEKP
jgi:hypothetical protein